MTAIVLDQIAKPFHQTCYSKLTHREQEIVNFLVGIDVLVITGNKVTKRSN